MYQSSSSSSSHRSRDPNEPTNTTGLMRNGSAPSSLLTTAVDGVMNPNREFSPLGLTQKPHSRFFPSESSSLTSDSSEQRKGIKVNTTIGLQRSYGMKHEGMMSSLSPSPPPPPPPLLRHSSSPGGLLNQLAHASAASNDENGFSMIRNRNISRLNSQLSFTRSQALGQITEENHSVVNDLNGETDPDHYGIGSWDDPSSIMISMAPNKRSSKNMNGDIVNGLSAMESQLQFSMQPGILEMGSMEKLLHIPPDSIPCKIRAKRGFATHPRSIAERERRTRISGKLKKLQDLVPNMDKQTSYADMLDLAVQHIKGLQNQVQKLNKEVENCTCGCRKPWNAGKEENR